jgi:hypothetical protein
MVMEKLPQSTPACLTVSRKALSLVTTAIPQQICLQLLWIMTRQLAKLFSMLKAIQEPAHIQTGHLT